MAKRTNWPVTSVSVRGSKFRCESPIEAGGPSRAAHHGNRGRIPVPLIRPAAFFAGPPSTAVAAGRIMLVPLILEFGDVALDASGPIPR